MSEINLYHGDCLKAMAQMPDKYYDLAIVDPPYGINAHKIPEISDAFRKSHNRNPSKPHNRLQRLNGGGGKLKNRLLNQSEINWDYKIPDQEYFAELFRVSKNCIIWGGNYFPLTPTRCIICWDKCQPWENFSQWEMAWTSFDSPASLFKLSNTGGHQRFSKIHPTEKPVELYQWLLKKYAKPGDKILDTHGGSMSIAIACHDMGFALDLWEIDKDYYDAGVKRFNTHKSQLQIQF